MAGRYRSGVCLPIDAPPSARQVMRPNVAGLVTHGSAGEAFYPLYSKPWAPWQSTVFPKVQPSSVAPNGLAPTWVVAVNTYSPIGHRNGLTEQVVPKAVPAGGIGRPTQRPRGYAMPYVTAWPQIAPRWPTWGERR